MQILILGGTGFLSGVVARAARDAGHAVTILTRGRSARPAPEGVTALVGDRKDRDAFVELFAGRSYDAVIDCICYTAADAETDVAAFAGRVGHLVMVSTDFTYGGEPRRLPLDEETPQNAVGDYGRNKVAAEKLLFAAWKDQRFPVTILRPPHIMGEGGLLGTGTLRGRDPRLLDRLRQGEPVVLLDGGALLIQPVVHRDIAAAALACFAHPATKGRAYNIAGPDAVTTRRYYEIATEEAGGTLGVLSLPSSVYLAAYPDRAPFAQHRVYDTRRLLSDAGFAPQIGLRDAIRETIGWLDAHPGDASPDPVESRVAQALAEHEAQVLRLLRG
jgi:nucleoside-diphosphate-sugar epimerase